MNAKRLVCVYIYLMVSVCIYYIKKIKIKIGFNMSYKDIMQQDLELNFALKLFVRGITLNKLNTVHG